MIFPTATEVKWTSESLGICLVHQMVLDNGFDVERYKLYGLSNEGWGDIGQESIRFTGFIEEN